MGSARQDYVRFLRWLHQPERQAPENVRRFANLVLGDFDAILDTSRQRNNRSARLASLARRALVATPGAMPQIEAEPAAAEFPWRRLQRLTVGPFRGFRREEVFDLQSRVILCYGPNGSGKTSLCEALERAMLGSVEEAELKRVDERRYLANIHARSFVEPRLVAVDARGRDMPVTANSDAYRFCFIEKNRIDAFSRIAARPTAQRTELIATLFGMDKFNEFANHFNDSMDAELVRLPEKQAALRGKREANARDQATADGEAAALATHEAENEAYATAFAGGTTYAQLKAFIGTAEAPGRLQALDQEIAAVSPPIVGITRVAFQTAYQAVNEEAERLRATKRELERRSSQVSFKSLFDAVASLQDAESDHCPACDTPLDQVVCNPYVKAREGLNELRDLAALQERGARELEALDGFSQTLRGHFASVERELHRLGDTESQVAQYIRGLPRQPRGDTRWMDVYLPEAGPDGGTPTVDQIMAIVDTIEEADTAARRRLDERTAAVQERNDLLARQAHIRERALRRELLVQQAADARARMVAFDEQNMRLIQEAETERQSIERDRPIKVAYDAFLPYLRRFRDQLPGMLMAGLNEQAMELYNEFNYEDEDADKLAALHLPLTGEQRIEIAFCGAPEERADALAVLSEGHIRCLGLAILLAKGLIIRTPLIVFDDAINAIDTDHRRGIRQTVFDSDRFRDVQLVVTCHSPEFIKDVRNNLPAHSQNDCSEYVLRRHRGDHHPRVTSNAVDRSYVARARAARELLNDREALGCSREALEMLSNRIWSWMQGHGIGVVRVEIDRAGGEPTLKNLCAALRKRLSDAATFAHANRQPILDALGGVLGIPEENLVWTYLNKGAHEEDGREDFDTAHVETVVQTVEALAALDLRRPRR
jgi:recombinational DNA repair ATPase RecF